MSEGGWQEGTVTAIDSKRNATLQFDNASDVVVLPHMNDLVKVGTRLRIPADVVTRLRNGSLP